MKRVPVFYILSTLFRVCFSILCSSIGTKLTWKRPRVMDSQNGGPKQCVLSFCENNIFSVFSETPGGVWLPLSTEA